MEVIKIGIYSFNAEALRDKSSKEARAFFKAIPQKIVDEAWQQANPKKAAAMRKRSED